MPIVKARRAGVARLALSTSTEKDMNEFEKWALSKELRIEYHPHPDTGFDYLDIETQMFWECWQAAKLSTQPTPDTPPMKYWQHDETGRVCKTVLQPSERWYEITEGHYDVTVKYMENAEVKSDG